jgi:hypothetical protein
MSFCWTSLLFMSNVTAPKEVMKYNTRRRRKKERK